MPFRLKQDFLAGFLFLAMGVAGLLFGAGYDMGTLSRAGPGFAPKVLSVGLIILGAIIAIRSIWQNRFASALHFRPLVAVLGALLIFALLIDRGGLFVTVVAMAGFMYLVGGERRWVEAAVFSAAFAVFCAALFVFGLKLPFSVGWW
jgi:hypothetical protein